MPKPISLKDLQHLQTEGADIRRQPREVVVDGLGAIVEQLKALAAREDTDNTEVLLAITELSAAVAQMQHQVTVQPPDVNIDFEPLVAALEPKDPVSYHFKIERNDRREMTDVIVTPRIE